MADRQASSDRGRPAIDWEDAYLYWASLPDTDRSYRAVADQFTVSVRTVETHGRTGRWKDRLARIKADVADAADRELAKNRLEKLAELQRLIDAALVVFAHQLRAGNVRVVPADLQRLYKLREELWADEAGHHNRTPVADPAAAPDDPEQRKRDLIIALDEAGVFDRLRNLTNHPYDTEDDHGSGDA